MVALSEQVLQGITERLVEALRPERIYLFGSHAYGIPGRNSDLDFVIVFPDAPISKPELDGKARRAIGDVGCDVDVLIYTATRFDRRSGWRANLEHTVRNKGRLLFGVDGMAFAKEWLEKARNDHRSAEALLELDPPTVDTAAFHCQQAVEKMLKAFLVHHNEVVEKQHDCGKLCDLCADVDPAFRGLRDRAFALNAYAVNARYPEEPSPPLEEVKQALTFVREAWEFVLGRLPKELRDMASPRCQEPNQE